VRVRAKGVLVWLRGAKEKEEKNHHRTKEMQVHSPKTHVQPLPVRFPVEISNVDAV